MKNEAATVLAAIGLSVSGAVRLLLTPMMPNKPLPFEPLKPNATTIAAMHESRRGTLPRSDDIEGLIADLDADD